MNNEIYKIEQELIVLQDKQNKSKEDNEKRSSLIHKLEKELGKEEFDLIQELNSIGLNITTIWDLVNTRESYPNAIPILIEHLQKDYHEKNKEGVVRALAVKEAIEKANPILITEYNRTPKDKMLLRWTIGNTIYTTITEDDVESILPIVLDKTNGMSRQMFVAALGKVKSEKAEDVLINLLDDDEVTPHALEALGRMKSKKAKDKISMLTNHSKALIRKEALKALKKVS